MTPAPQGLGWKPQDGIPQAKLARKVREERPGGEEEDQDKVSHLAHQSPPLRSRLEFTRRSRPKGDSLEC